MQNQFYFVLLQTNEKIVFFGITIGVGVDVVICYTLIRCTCRFAFSSYCSVRLIAFMFVQCTWYKSTVNDVYYPCAAQFVQMHICTLKNEELLSPHFACLSWPQSGLNFISPNEDKNEEKKQMKSSRLSNTFWSVIMQRSNIKPIYLAL